MLFRESEANLVANYAGYPSVSLHLSSCSGGFGSAVITCISQGRSRTLRISERPTIIKSPKFDTTRQTVPAVVSQP